MESPQEVLIGRFVARGVFLDQIPTLLRNVLGIIGNGGLLTTRTINEQLERPGWGCEVLDETSLQLIVYILESQGGYRVRHYDLGTTEKSAGQIGDFEVCQQWQQPTQSDDRRRNEMTVKQLQKMATELGIKTVGLKKAEMIKVIQIAEGNFDCFGTATDYCDQQGCLFRKDCLSS
jgi:hypothetical protein